MNELNFWKKLPYPITAMAPMAGVTDSAFRWMMVKYSRYGGKDIGNYGEKKLKELERYRSGGPDVIYTEFVSADGIFLGGKEELKDDMKYTDLERPIVAQFFSSNMERMKKASFLAREMGFDGIDINMGCPDRSVCKQGAGSELIKSPKEAYKIIKTVKKESGGLPVSVKTRAGYYRDSELEDWIGGVLETEPSALVLHARTKADVYKRPARWDLVKKTVEIRNRMNKETLVLGNGDITSLSDLKEKVKTSGADGAMVGRALIGNPWFFSTEADISKLSVKERLGVLVEHCRLFEDLFGDKKSFAFMKKHYRSYVSGWDGAKDLRISLMTANTSKEVEEKVEDYLKSA